MKTKFRFKVGDKVWVRDHVHPKHSKKNKASFSLGGYTIVEAVVVERHSDQGRHPAYPNGEGYELDGNLWWSCYPGCRVWATREQAIAARMGDYK